jgi:hypothetical protein
MLPRVVYANPRNYRPLTSGVIMGAPEWRHQDQEISPNFAAPVQVQSGQLQNSQLPTMDSRQLYKFSSASAFGESDIPTGMELDGCRGRDDHC